MAPNDQSPLRHAPLLLLLAWLASRAYILSSLGPNADTQIYYILGNAAGAVRAEDASYPPLAMLLLRAVAAVTHALFSFERVFAGLMLVFDGILALAVGRLAAAAAGRRAGLAATALYLGASGILTSLIFQRYDLAAAACVTLGLLAVVKNQRPWRAAVFFALSIGLKLYAVVLLPLVAIFWLQKRVARRDLAVAAGVLAVGLALPFIAWEALGGGETFGFLAFNAARGLQLESVYAGLILFISLVFPLQVAVDSRFHAIEVVGRAVDLLLPFSGVAMVVALGIALAFAGRRLRAAVEADRAAALVEGALVVLLALIGSAKVLSPQYLLWIAPLWAVVASGDRPTVRRLGAALFFLSGPPLAVFYIDLRSLDWPAILLLNLRNAVLLSLPFVAWRPAPAPVPARFDTGLLRAALAGIGLWLVAANLNKINTNDIWVHLRVGRDLVATHMVPLVDTYSAVAAGRPFIAHEWLSGLLFFAVNGLWPGFSLSVLPAAAALVCAGLLVASVSREERRHAVFIPLLVAALYLLTYRLVVRPHLFSLVAICAWTAAIAHWRRTGRWWPLYALVPLQILWTNLHGEATLGIVLMGALACAYAAAADGAAARRLVVLTGLIAAATLVNPYGFGIVGFAWAMIGKNAYIQASIWEWQSPLSADHQQAWFAAFVIGLFWLVLAATAASVAFAPRGKERRVDLVLLLIAAALGVKAMRFLPYIGLVGFPIAVRQAGAAWQNFGLPPARPRRAYELAAIGLLLFTTLAFGYVIGPDPTLRRTVAWGYGTMMPQAEVQWLAQHGVQGAVFNEYIDGAYVIYAAGPALKPVIDARIDIYGAELYGEYEGARRSVSAFRAYLEKYQVAAVMLRRGAFNAPFLRELAADPGWREAPLAGARAVFFRAVR